MLRELSVQNLALIEDLRVELQPGFCAWTGETGAGKTLLLSALGLLLGERGSSDLIRSGAEELRISGRFELSDRERQRIAEPYLEGLLDDGQLVLLRRLNRAGRSTAYANEQPVSVGALRRLGTQLVNIHGQRESQSLLDSAYQLEMLDGFGGLTEQRQRYLSAAEQLRKLRRRHSELAGQREQRQRELSLIRFERDELDTAALVEGEKQALLQERERLVHALSLCSFAAEGCSRLYDDDGAVYDQVGRVHREAQKWSAIDPELTDAERRLQNLCSEIQDLAETLRNLSGRWQPDTERHRQVEERLQLLHKLEQKYGRPLEDLIAYRKEMDAREAALVEHEDETATLQAELRGVFAQLKQAGEHLSKERSKVAKRLVKEVQKQLADLGMKEARLDAAIERVALEDDPFGQEIPAFGLDQFELMLSANRGEAPRALRKIASGGELSRIMLALKSVLARQDEVGTLVFDEIDANVGGRRGDALGQKLAALGRTHQVICVTHLSQVASYAGYQWSIRKQQRGRRTVTTIIELSEPERLDELASMLRGDAKSETTLQEAAAMLEAARRRR